MDAGKAFSTYYTQRWAFSHRFLNMYITYCMDAEEEEQGTMHRALAQALGLDLSEGLSSHDLLPLGLCAEEGSR